MKSINIKLNDIDSRDLYILLKYLIVVYKINETVFNSLTEDKINSIFRPSQTCEKRDIFISKYTSYLLDREESSESHDSPNKENDSPNVNSTLSQTENVNCENQNVDTALGQTEKVNGDSNNVSSQSDLETSNVEVLFCSDNVSKLLTIEDRYTQRKYFILLIFKESIDISRLLHPNIFITI